MTLKGLMRMEKI